MNEQDLFEAFGEIDHAYIEEANRTSKKRSSIWIRACAAAAAAAIIVIAVFSYLSYRKNNYILETEFYTLVNQNGNYHLQFHNENQVFVNPEEYNKDLLIACGTDVVYFHSIDEMRSDILGGNFTDRELQAISDWYGDGSGRISIVNLSCLYEPTFPETLNGYIVQWDGDSYGFAFPTGMEANLDEECTRPDALEYYLSYSYAHMHLCSKESYQTMVRNLKDAEDESNQNKIIVSKRTTFSKTIYTQEVYNDHTSTVPSVIYFYGKEGNVYFYGKIRGDTSFMEQQTLDQIYKFGVKKNKG